MPALSQDSVLFRTFSFKNGTIKTGSALEAITRKTGYYFTYDSKIIDAESKTVLQAKELPLAEILRNVFQNDSLYYTVIGKNIIICRTVPELSSQPLNPATEVSFRITGKVIDNTTGEPLPFATVAVMNKPRGTVTNLNGSFSMNIVPDILNDTLVFSYLGYMNQLIPVRQAIGNDFSIQLFQ